MGILAQYSRIAILIITHDQDSLQMGILAQYSRIAILIITHDRYFLDNVTGWILELDRGRGIPYEGNCSAYLTQKAKRYHQEQG